jgi:predicted enzyme related to lactoylglutathione lyase
VGQPVVHFEVIGKDPDQAEKLGGTHMMGPDSVPGGPTIGLIVDPQGHVIGLVAAG